MDREKIQHKVADQNEIDPLAPVPRLKKSPAQLFYRFGGSPGRHGYKPRPSLSGREHFFNGVVCAFPLSSSPRKLHEVPVQLQDEIRRQIHVFVMFMDRFQHVPVPGDLRFRTIPRFRDLSHDGIEPPRRHGNPGEEKAAAASRREALIALEAGVRGVRTTPGHTVKVELRDWEGKVLRTCYLPHWEGK